MSSFELRWTQAISEVSTPFWGSFSIFLWGCFPNALSFGASSSSFICPTLFFMGGRALLLGYEGFFFVNVLLCLCEHLNHVCLGIFGDRKHQVVRLNTQAGDECRDRKFLIGYIYF